MSSSSPVALLGRWRIQRRLADRAAGVSGTMTGTLVLSPDASEIDWLERGVLHWLGRDVSVVRRYRLHAGEHGWWVSFEDGRPFHRWTPGVVVRHECRADLYQGMISVDGPTSWRTLWDVRGPAKDQRIITRLER